MSVLSFRASFSLWVACSLLAVPAAGQQPAASDAGAVTESSASSAAASSSDELSDDQAAREQKLAEYLNGVKLIGKFTIDGQEIDAKTEEYTISKCEKIDKPDTYRMTARIKYGDVDSELPLDIKILWSGRTPVITLDKFWIPGMGTFGARILIHSDRYAGTWVHHAGGNLTKDVGGHMFGRIEKIESE